MNRLITIFTPTYNRCGLLENLYKSLCDQINKNFVWLIIDDGSTDNTSDLVTYWKQTSDFEINYIYQDNQGLSAGYNTAISMINTELSMCVDSDDWLYDEYSTDVIEKKWLLYRDDNDVAGIVGMDAASNGQILGKRLTDGERLNFLIYNSDKEMRADKKIVVRTKCYKEVSPVKLYDDEKGISPHILHMKICEKRYFVTIAAILCTVFYQTDGMSKKIWKQYYNSPKSFADLKEYCLNHEQAGIKRQLLSAIHYDASCVLARRRVFTRNSPRKILTWTLYPVSIFIAIMIIKKGKQIG